MCDEHNLKHVHGMLSSEIKKQKGINRRHVLRICSVLKQPLLFGMSCEIGRAQDATGNM